MAFYQQSADTKRKQNTKKRRNFCRKKRIPKFVNFVKFIEMRHFPNPYRDFVVGSHFEINSPFWLSKAREVANLILSHRQHVESNIDGGLYVGPAGVAYALWKFSTYVEPYESRQILDYAQKLINMNLTYVHQPNFQKDKKNKYGFLLGNSNFWPFKALL